MEELLIVSLILGAIGLYVNTIPTMKSKMVSYELIILSATPLLVYAYMLNNQILVFFSLIFTTVGLRGIYTHQQLADVETAYNKSMLEVPKKW